MSEISELKKICSFLDEKEQEMDRNFFAVNMHGYETKEDYIVPKGVRIIMFCYSGKKLYMRPEFNQFNWENIFLNEDASYNYCTFLANVSRYSSIRDHFCVYKEGDKIKEIMLGPDDSFRDGIFQLPVRVAVYEGEDTVYISSPEIFSDTVEKTRNVKRVLVDVKKTAELVSYKDTQAIFFSRWKSPLYKLSLSKIIKELQFQVKDFTLLLMICREGKKYKLAPAPRVYEELEALYGRYAEDYYTERNKSDL